MIETPTHYLFKNNQELIAYLKESRILGHLPEELLMQLLPLSDFVYYPANTTIIEEGQKNEKVYFLIRGTVGIYANHDLILTLQRNGDIFGEMEVIGNKPHLKSVKTLTPVDLFCIHSKDIGKFTDIDSGLLQNALYRLFAVILTNKLEITTQKAQQFEDINLKLENSQNSLKEAYASSQLDIARRIQVEKKLSHYQEHLEELVKNRTADLRKAKQLAESANLAKGNFLATMSHELRTPLNGILGMAELALQTNLDQQQLKYIETIFESGQALMKILGDILDFSKIDASKFEIEQTDFNLWSVLDHINDLFSASADAKNIGFHFDIRKNFQHNLMGDPVRLTQILSNLLANAIKFTDQGSVKTTVTLVNETENQLILQFKVSDSGIGISNEKLKNIFQAFTQADSSTTRKYGGTGLGLTITKNFVELMGGNISVQSDINKGSEFKVILPFKKQKPKSVTDDPKPTTQLKGDSEFKKNNIRLLLVEDEKVNQMVISGLLEHLGYTVDIVSNGKEALKYFDKTLYDLILMDCLMPEMDGFEATREIRRLEQKEEKKSNTPIIAITAKAMKGDNQRCLEAGMNDFIAKPVMLNELKKTLDQFLA